MQRNPSKIEAFPVGARQQLDKMIVFCINVASAEVLLTDKLKLLGVAMVDS